MQYSVVLSLFIDAYSQINVMNGTIKQKCKKVEVMRLCLRQMSSSTISYFLSLFLDHIGTPFEV